jgi:hypothetical protein
MVAPRRGTFRRSLLFTLAFCAELEALLIESSTTSIVEGSPTLGIEQHRVAVPGPKWREKGDVVPHSCGRLLRNVVRGEGSVDFVEDAEPVVVKR